MKSFDIKIGKRRNELTLDAAKLVEGRCLIQGTSGSGKSYLARVIAEQTILKGLLKTLKAVAGKPLQDVPEVLEGLVEALGALLEAPEPMDLSLKLDLAQPDAPIARQRPTLRVAPDPPVRPNAAGVTRQDATKTSSRASSGFDRMLYALAQHRELEKTTLAIMAGISSKTGTFRNYLSRLRTLGLINRSEPIVAAESLRAW